jgi:hypothetical protein
MSEWWTYRLSSFLLFSPRTYWRLHELYNVDVWPLQVAGLGIGLAIVVLARHRRPWAARSALLLLGACWIWVAWAYLLRRYATINWAATYFAAAFVIEALLLAAIALSGRMRVAPAASLQQRIGLGVVVFALVAQPALGRAAGRALGELEFFGVAPDPTAVATMGVVLLAGRGVHWGLLVVPLLWCAVSGALQWGLGSWDAMALPLAGVLVVTSRWVGRPR